MSPASFVSQLGGLAISYRLSVSVQIQPAATVIGFCMDKRLRKKNQTCENEGEGSSLVPRLIFRVHILHMICALAPWKDTESPY